MIKLLVEQIVALFKFLCKGEKMNKRVKKLWVAALRSRRFKQGKKSLHQPKNKTHCCLGVLCELFLESGAGYGLRWETDPAGIASLNGTNGYLPSKVQKWAGLSEQDPVVPFRHSDVGETALSDLNDSFEWPFYKIAAKIEKHL